MSHYSGRHIMKADDESINKGKPVERRRRKAMDLTLVLPKPVTTARLLIDTVAESLTDDLLSIHYSATH